MYKGSSSQDKVHVEEIFWTFHDQTWTFQKQTYRTKNVHRVTTAEFRKIKILVIKNQFELGTTSACETWNVEAKAAWDENLLGNYTKKNYYPIPSRQTLLRGGMKLVWVAKNRFRAGTVRITGISGKADSIISFELFLLFLNPVLSGSKSIDRWSRFLTPIKNTGSSKAT